MQFFLVFLCFTIVKADIPPKKGPYTVKNAKVHVGGYVAGGGSIQTAEIWYPVPQTGEEKFPFVMFMHGMTAGGPEVPIAYGPGMVEPLASFGFIVMAPESCLLLYCADFYKDGMHTLSVAQTNTTLHPSLKTADFSKVGVFGHSMGGAATVYMSNYNQFLGGVALHPSTFMGDGSKRVQIPLWYATGSNDNIVPPAGVIYSYDMDPMKSKVVAEMDGANHFEPTAIGPCRWTPWINQYMLCHIKGDQNACPYIYGTDNSSLCGQKQLKMDTCEAHQ